MQLTVAAIGRLKKGAEAELAERYAGRIAGAGKAVGLTGPQLIESPESRAQSAEQRKREEAEALTGKLQDGASLILFDERGETPDSRAFAKMLGGLADTGTKQTAFLIGGPDGLDPALRDRAHRTVSFGRLTMPHQIVRVLVLEQLYRAITILSGHPYHRD